ncbi:MAG: trehalose-phosphatase [Phycisphaerales bacterium]|nr:trehalose-phosphatase [Phycisphaerales bacterium]
MPVSLRERLEAVIQSPILLVACDYDGTLAPIVDDPAMAHGDPSALSAFAEIDETNWTESAVISGRALAELRGFLGAIKPGYVVGSHGAEWQRVGIELSGEQRRTLARVCEAVRGVVGRFAGSRVEAKPAGVALHVRGLSEERATEAMVQAEAACLQIEGVHVRRGSGVVEFMVVAANKGDAIKRVRHVCGATSVIFIGDDATDEDVFRAMSGDDVSVKVGRGETAAGHRVGDVADVARLLRFVADRRADWARRRNLPDLARCAILSDQRTAVVVSPGAKISWMCLPRLDSAAVFASLVGEDSDGVFEVQPVEVIGRPRVSYDGDSFICVTEWDGLRVTDYLDCSGGRAFQKAGRSDLFRVIEAAQPARVRFAPRLDYGRIHTQIVVRSEGLEVQGSNDPIVLRSPGIRWTIVNEGVHQTAVAEITPGGEAVVLELRYGTSNFAPTIEPEVIRREQNRRFWSGWAGSLRLPTRYAPLVKRSALVLKALSYGPSGAIAAAATTSLPEQMGGVRNWDYRYCWPRDAAKAASSLVRLGNTGHAMKLLDWLLEVVDRCETPDRLHPIYSLSGGLLPPEAELGHLGGFGQSRPVRIGNAAANQVQLDVFGPIVNLVAMLAERGAPIAPDHWRLVRAMVRAVESRWREPDHGIWEMRIERRHHVHSKVMCWHTVDRAMVVERAVSGTRNPEWSKLADQIREDVLCNGWNEAAGAFTGAYGHAYLDAGVLKIGLTGLIDPSDPRWIATVEMIERSLRKGPTVRRYEIDDGLPGTEGGMHICTGWLIESLISIGRLDTAAELLDQFASTFAGPGVLSEQYDHRHRMPIGNLAQAYSHLAFIDAVVAMDSVQQSKATE